MDLLSDVLLALRVQSTIISRWDLTAPWGVAIGEFEPAWSICVLEGELWVAADGQCQRLGAGDALLAPRTANCTLASDEEPADSPATLGELWRGHRFEGFGGAVTQAPVQLEWGGGGPRTRVLVFAFDFQQTSPLKLLEQLPELIVIRQDATALFPSMRPAFDVLMQTTGATRPGYLAIANQLAELIFLSLLRAHILTQPQQQRGWLRGLTDPRIGKALTAIHTEPAHPWSLTQLAAHAGMSRSAFADRFTRLVERTPADYLNEWRTRLAADALRNSNEPLPLIAERFGFESDRTFRRNFRRYMGVSPLRYRRSSANG
ncbi:MAG: AraC family transcriptional regulator [Spongiibacteraceae bacterium]|jgi:AraC-like DNA-binding protein|nr:AraC family transcriptional regulator [Spongiibacteraceae bacterium]